MNALNTYLVKLIKAQGPITVASFMAEALGNIHAPICMEETSHVQYILFIIAH